MRLFSSTKKRAIAIAVAVLCLSGFLVGPHLATLLYWYRDLREFPTEPELPPAGPFFRLPLTSPKSGDYGLADLFPALTFEHPTEMVFGPGGRTFVLERAGRLWVLAGDNPETRQLVIDFSAEVGSVSNEEGAVGLALHPSFGTGGPANTRIFVYFTAHEGSKRFDRLVRYDLNADFSGFSSSLRMIDQLDDHGDHNGGTLRFWTDGYLYVSVGDEGNCVCGNHQRIDKDLFSGVLRIDVDGDEPNAVHPIRRQPETGRTQGYWIPNDNPFVGANTLEEFWSIGLRNPFRIAFDPVTGRLFGGDVGHGDIESVFEAKKGSNHRWSMFEGNIEHRFVDAPKIPELHGVMTEPVFAYPHENMNLAVIGGLVYRGTKFPELVGKYIYGDNVSGRIWALDLSSKDNRHLLTLPERADHGLVSIVADPAGEVFILAMGAKGSKGSHIYRLVAGQESSERGIPTLLSEAGLFADMKNLTINEGLRYEIALPMWTGRADTESTRWVIRLGRHSSPTFRIAGEWELRGGLAFVKHLRAKGKNVETQVLLMSDAKEGYGLSYEWNETGTDATLVTTAHDKDIEGGPWHFAASEECSMCHNAASNLALGFSSRQLNVNDQLLRLRREGMFEPRASVTRRIWGLRQPVKAFRELLKIEKALENEPLVQAGLLERTERLSPPDSPASLDEKVRSYLDVNCGACHRPGGAGGTSYDARYEIPMADKGLQGDAHRPIDAATKLAVAGQPDSSLLFVRMRSPEPGVHMPPVGPPVPDPAGVQLMVKWVRSLR